MSITEISIKRPSLIIVIFLTLTVLGIFSYTKLSYELIPKFSAPAVLINTVYPGASPAEVENSVTRVVEDAVSTVEGVKSIRGTSVENISFVFLELENSTDVNLAMQSAQRKINARLRFLPDGADPPSLAKWSSDEFPILNIAFTSDMEERAFFDLVADRVKPAISSVPGVGNISVIGGQEREIQVNVHRQELEARGLSILQIVQAINEANLDFPTGKIESEAGQLVIRLAGKLESVAEMQSLTVARDPATGAPIKLGEIAEVMDAKKDLVSLSRVNGADAISIQVSKSTDANSVAVAEGVLAKLEVLKTQYAASGLDFEIANDQTKFTRAAVDAVSHDLLLAIVLVAVVMLFFLHSIRNALIVMLAIPTSLVATLIMMYAMGYTLNLMTLLAMSLVIGILVDDSIVVLENIYRFLEKGVPRREAALRGRNEIGFTALSITLVDVVVFVPIALAEGIVGQIMASFALVVTFATLMSLFVSFTLTPMLASRFSRLEKYGDRTLAGLVFNGFERRLEKFNDWYGRLLALVLKPLRIPYRNGAGHFNFHLNALLVFGFTFGLFFSSFGLLSGGYIGSAFVTPGDRGEFIINLELPKDANLYETNLAAIKAEEFLLGQKEIVNVFSTIGQISGPLGPKTGENLVELAMILVPKDQRIHTDFYAQKIRDELERRLSGVKVTSAPVSFFGGADMSPIMIFFAGPDKDEVEKYASFALSEIKKIPGILEPKLSNEAGRPELKVDVDRERMAALGINMAALGATMQTAFNGNTDAQFRAGDKEYDINVRMDNFNRNGAEDIAGLTVMNARGQLIRIDQFADIGLATGPDQLERNMRQPSVTLTSKVLGRSSGDIGNDIRAIFSKTPPPAGVNISYDGDMKNQQEGFGSLGLAFLASILFVYFILVALYDSWLDPVVVSFSIPVAIMGSLFAMALTMSVLDIFSILGIIMTVGLVAKNAILLVDFTSQSKREGMATIPALVSAGRTRLRPILMTTLSMAIGFLPIALADGAASEWKNALAWALIGGLLTSMVFTLLIVPVAYLWMDSLRRGIRRLL